MNSRLLKRFGAVGLLVFAGALMLLVGRGPSVGKADEGEGKNRLAGTWNVTLLFQECDTLCPCPAGPNIPIRALHQYQKGGSLVEVPSSLPFRGPGLGSWERLDDNQFAARFRFFVFGLTPPGSEIVTSQITLTGPDSFTAAETFDLFNAAGTKLNDGEVCHINATGTRLAEPSEPEDKD